MIDIKAYIYIQNRIHRLVDSDDIFMLTFCTRLYHVYVTEKFARVHKTTITKIKSLFANHILKFYFGNERFEV